MADKKPKETALQFDVLGYGVPPYGASTCVVIRVGGTGPRGKIKALAFVGNKFMGSFVTWEGDGQYSAMHGTSSLHTMIATDDTDVPGLTAQVVSDLAAKWVAENPKAFYEYNVATAKKHHDKAAQRIETLREQLQEAESLHRTAVANLVKCEADTEVVYNGLAPDSRS